MAKQKEQRFEKVVERDKDFNKNIFIILLSILNFVIGYFSANNIIKDNNFSILAIYVIIVISTIIFMVADKKPNKVYWRKIN